MTLNDDIHAGNSYVYALRVTNRTQIGHARKKKNEGDLAGAYFELSQYLTFRSLGGPEPERGADRSWQDLMQELGAAMEDMQERDDPPPPDGPPLDPPEEG